LRSVFCFGETNLIDCEIFLFIAKTTMSQTISDVANDIGNGFGKTSKFISFLYSAYQEREREREREERDEHLYLRIAFL